MHAVPPKLLRYPRPTGHDSRRPPPTALLVPGLNRDELLVIPGFIAVLLAIAVPVVRAVRESAQRAADVQRQATDPLMLE